MSTNFIFLSDTHGKHDQIKVPDGDYFIFCGDMCSKGTISEVESFSNYIQKLPHKHKIVIAGNHDFPFEDERKEQAERIIKDSGAIYLNDSGLQIDGFNIWGSPIQPWFHDWAFNRKPGEDIKKHWDMIPLQTDILITHGPPHGILDKTNSGIYAGCPELLKKVNAVQPKIHAYGHIHEAFGKQKIGETIFINASNLNFNYVYANLCDTVEIS